MRRKKITYLSVMLLVSQGLTPRRLGNWLTLRKSQAIKHLQDKEKLIEEVFKQCVLICLMMKRSVLVRKKITFMLESPLKSNWVIFLDKLDTSEDKSMLTTILFKTLVQESISKGKEFQPFWTPAYKALSEKLLSPTVIDLVDLDSISSTCLLKKREEKSQSLKTIRLQQAKSNLQKTYCPLSTSTLVDKWEKEVILEKKKKLRTIKIKIYPTQKQKKLINELFDITRYIYNKANALVKSKEFKYTEYERLRNYIVTVKSKKGITTPRKDFELPASDSTRQCAVRNLCDAYKTAHANLKAYNIRAFNISYKKKNEPRQCVELGSRDLSMSSKGFKIYPDRWKENAVLRISKKNQKKYGNYKVNHNCDILRQKGVYYIGFVIPQKDEKNNTFNKACGVDLGIRTLASSYGTNGIIEYHGNMKLLKSFNRKLDEIKNRRRKKRKRKKALNKIEKKKIDFTDNLHWCLIKELLDENDIIFMGDIKSHDMTKRGKNKIVNRTFNDLKFYVFKTRLLYKAESRHKKVFMVPEQYTTQCCSGCGSLWKTIGSSKTYSCRNCNLVCDRDTNSAKNIFMKGIINNL